MVPFRWLAAVAVSWSMSGPAPAAQEPAAQTNPLWHEQKIKNYLPHMTWPEVADLLTRSDIVLIPVASIEQHGLHAPMGNDFYLGIETSKLIAQRTDVLVAPLLMVGQSPYHTGFPGSVTLSGETIQRVYFEAVQSLIAQGFRRFIFYNSHTGNTAITNFVVDRINQETEAVAVELGEGVSAMRSSGGGRGAGGGQGGRSGGAAAGNAQSPAPERPFDRHGGVSETARGLYLFPTLVDTSKAETATLTFPPRLEALLPLVKAGDPVATLIFLKEALKNEATGKGSSAAEMSSTGSWSERNPAEATVEQGRRQTESFVDAAVAFIDRWKALQPNGPGR
jgi:creatinine amidohydrolase